MPHFQLNLKPVKSIAWFLTLALTSHWTTACRQLEYLDAHLARSALAVLRTDLVSSCDQTTGWPQKPKIFVDLRARDQIPKENFCSWEFKHFNDSELYCGTPGTSCHKMSSRHPLCLWGKHCQVCWGSDLSPTFSLSWPRQGWAQGSSRASFAQAWPQGGGSWGSVSPLRHVAAMWTDFTYFCSCGCALGSCLAPEFPHLWSGWAPWAGEGWVIHPFRAGCGPCSPWNLPAFESQTIDRLQGLLQLSGTLHKVWHLLWLLILPAFPRKRLTQKGADSAIWSCLYSCTCKASRENVSWCLGRQIISRWKGFIAKFPRAKAWES